MLLTGPQVLAYFRKAGKLMVAEHDGRLFVTDSFMLVAFDPERSVVASLLGDYNLPVEPMTCTVGRTIRRVPNGKVPDVASLVPAPFTKKKRPAPLTRWQIDRHDVLLDHGYGITAEVWTAPDGTRTSLDRAKRTVVDGLQPGGEWVAGAGALSPVRKLNDDGVQTALLMPLRTMFHEVSDRKAAA